MSDLTDFAGKGVIAASRLLPTVITLAARRANTWPYRSLLLICEFRKLTFFTIVNFLKSWCLLKQICPKILILFSCCTTFQLSPAAAINSQDDSVCILSKTENSSWELRWKNFLCHLSLTPAPFCCHHHPIPHHSLIFCDPSWEPNGKEGGAPVLLKAWCSVFFQTSLQETLW